MLFTFFSFFIKKKKWYFAHVRAALSLGNPFGESVQPPCHPPTNISRGCPPLPGTTCHVTRAGGDTSAGWDRTRL